LYVVAELFGRGKHIGRWWTFALLTCTPVIPGIIALLFSPKASSNPTKANKTTKSIGWFMIVIGITGVIPAIFAGPIGFAFSLSFGVSGAYLIQLGKGNVFNKDPKSYFKFQKTAEVYNYSSDESNSYQEQTIEKRTKFDPEAQLKHYKKLKKYLKRLWKITFFILVQILVFWFIVELKGQCSSCGYDVFGGIVLSSFIITIPILLFTLY
jgi:hypothetical protein